jgi:hypothetical protein
LVKIGIGGGGGVDVEPSTCPWRGGRATTNNDISAIHRPIKVGGVIVVIDISAGSGSVSTKSGIIE